jgi:hypothetical protein
VSDFHCYVSKEGSDYDQAVRREWQQQDDWSKVMTAMAVHMGEEFKSIYTEFALGFPPAVVERFKPENKKLFRKDGFLKKSGKQAKALEQFYSSILVKFNLKNYRTLSMLRFSYNMFKSSPKQESQSYRDFDGRIYMRCNFIPGGAKNSLTEMSELEYAETYTNLLKEQERRKALKEGE